MIRGAGRTLSRHAHVWALDLRNHGDSPHADSHSLEDMLGDLDEWLGSSGVKNPVLLGHSMGGLVTMAYALRNPGGISALIVVDIAPKAYGHENEFRALRMDVSPYRSRREVDLAMEGVLANPMVRKFVQMNLERTSEGYRWKINVEALAKATYMDAFGRVKGLSFEGPALFLRGGKSPYVAGDDLDLIHGYFPSARLETVPEGDHWLHYSAAKEFEAAVGDFLEEL